MTFVITGGCCNDASCVDVCPVDCIRPHPDDPEFGRAEQLYIDPSSCIDCGACMYACPVAAIHDEHDLPVGAEQFADANAAYFRERPLVARSPLAPPTVVSEPVPARVAVVGTGPAGCYAVAELSEMPGVEVAVFDRLPTPFGLVRSGVAPDHPDTKLISDFFGQVLERPNVTCYFNVEVGTDVTVDELRASHHAVIYAGGAPGDRRLGLSGEDIPGSHSAREFVAWYNGHPDFAQMKFDLTGETVVLVGNGNVALDVARILMQSPETLAGTDISDEAVEQLRDSHVREVIIAARRGPEDAACSYSELLALSRLPGVEVRTRSEEVLDVPSRALSAAERRKLALFQQLSEGAEHSTVDGRRITFRFGVRPVALAGHDTLESVYLQPSARPEAPPEEVRSRLLLRAIGYQVQGVLGLPYDETSGTLSNAGGRLVDAESGQVLDGLYCVGWAKRGPTGVIGTNKVCAQETVAAVGDDLRSGRLVEPALSKAQLTRLIESRQPHVVDLLGWQAIDSAERRDGASHTPAKPRRKILHIDAMVTAAGAQRTGLAR